MNASWVFSPAPERSGFVVIVVYFTICLTASDLGCSTRDLFVAVQGLLSSCDMWAPEDRGSVVEVCGLSTCGAQA